MSQTSYSQNMAVGRAGMVADNKYVDVVSRVNPTDVIPFGVVVCKGTADRDVKLPVAATDITAQGKLEGVALIDTIQSVVDTNVAEFPVKSVLPVLQKGVVWVLVEEAVSPTDTPYVRFANGVADATKVQKGAVRKSADSTTAAAMPNARFLTTAAAGGLAQLQFTVLA